MFTSQLSPSRKKCLALLSFFLFWLFSSLKSKVVPKVHLYVAPSHTILTVTQSLNSQSGPAADALVEKPRFYFCPLYESVLGCCAHHGGPAHSRYISASKVAAATSLDYFYQFLCEEGAKVPLFCLGLLFVGHVLQR